MYRKEKKCIDCVCHIEEQNGKTIDWRIFHVRRIVMWLMMLSGIGMMAVAGTRYYKENASKSSSTPLPTPDSRQEENGAPTAPKTVVSTIPGMVPPYVE